MQKVFYYLIIITQYTVDDYLVDIEIGYYCKWVSELININRVSNCSSFKLNKISFIYYFDENLRLLNYEINIFWRTKSCSSHVGKNEQKCLFLQWESNCASSVAEHRIVNIYVICIFGREQGLCVFESDQRFRSKCDLEHCWDGWFSSKGKWFYYFLDLYRILWRFYNDWIGVLCFWWMLPSLRISHL